MMDQRNVDPLSTDDNAPNSDPGGDEGGKTGRPNTEQGDGYRRETHLEHDQSTNTDNGNVVEACGKATSDACTIAADSVEPQQGSMCHEPVTIGRSSSSSQLDNDQPGMDCGDVGNGDVVPNTSVETNNVLASPVKERNAYETGDGRAARHEVIVDGIILSESDTEASDSDNDAAIDGKDNILHSSDSDGGSLADNHVSSARGRQGNDGVTSSGETVKKPSDNNEKVYPLRSSSLMEEQVDHCLQHGYELGKKTDSLQFAKIHRGRVTEGKLEASVKIRDMIHSVEHDQVSPYVELSL